MKKQKKLNTILESAISKILINELSPETRMAAYRKAKDKSKTGANDMIKAIGANQMKKFLELPNQYHKKAQKIVDKIASEYADGDSDLLLYELVKDEDSNIFFRIDFKKINNPDKPNDFRLVPIFTSAVSKRDGIEAVHHRGGLPGNMENIKTSPTINRMLNRLLNDLQSEAMVKESKQINESRFALASIAKSFLKEESDAWKYAYMPDENSSETFSNSEKKKDYKRFIDGVVQDFYEMRNDEKDYSSKVTDDELETLVMKYAEMDDDIFRVEFLESNKKVVDMIVKDLQDEIGTPDFEYEGMPRSPYM